ncbi:MAG: FHA domain-containing protein, partial [Usitatibacteraceae bacterium]
LAVSGEHAAIITILNDSFIEDLNSTNGTLVNGKPIKKHFLQNNDVIEIGKHKLKYFNDAPVAASAGDFEKTMIIRRPAAAAAPATSGTPPMASPPAMQAPAPAAPANLSDTQTNMRPLQSSGAPPPVPTPLAAAPAHAQDPNSPSRDAAIQVLSGAAAGRTLDLVKNLTTIGKPGVQVAVITRRPTGFFITHVEGAVYPTINGVALGGPAKQLQDHDLIEIAGVKMEFFYKP